MFGIHEWAINSYTGCKPANQNGVCSLRFLGGQFLIFLSIFEVQIGLWPQSCALFADLIFPEFFFTFSSGNRALANPLCFVVDNFWRSSPATPETETLLQRPRIFSPVNSHTSALLPFPLLNDGWLAWWCGWHDKTWTWWQDCLWKFIPSLEMFELNFLWLNTQSNQ